jgi:hypothetical protein
MPGVWEFYYDRAKEAWVAALKMANAATGAVFLAVFAICVFNKEIAARISNWHGVSRWWGAAWVGVVVLVALARAHYDREMERQTREAKHEEHVESIEAKLESLVAAQPQGMTIMRSSGGAHHNTVGNVRIGPGDERPIEATLSPDECERQIRELTAQLVAFKREEPVHAIGEPHEEYERKRLEREADCQERFAGKALFLFGEACAHGVAHESDEFRFQHFRVHGIDEVIALLGSFAERLAGRGGN